MVEETTLVLKHPPETDGTKGGRKSAKNCNECGKPANGSRGLCNTHLRLWHLGDRLVTADPPKAGGPERGQGRRGPCGECTDPAELKGLCRKHYQKNRSDRRRKRCTIEGCANKRRYRAKLHCDKHSACTYPGCSREFKARRLCGNHYRSAYLNPLLQEERRRVRSDQGSQGTLELEQDEWRLPNPPSDTETDGLRLHEGAPPIRHTGGLSPAGGRDVPRVRGRPQRAAEPGNTDKGNGGDRPGKDSAPAEEKD